MTVFDALLAPVMPILQSVEQDAINMAMKRCVGSILCVFWCSSLPNVVLLVTP